MQIPHLINAVQCHHMRNAAEKARFQIDVRLRSGADILTTSTDVRFTVKADIDR